MRNWKKGMIGVVCAAMVFGTPGVMYAAGCELSIKLPTVTKYTATFSYGTGGNTLKLATKFYETHKTTGQVYHDDASNKYGFGSTTTISVSRTSDEGYEYTKVEAWGYANDEEVAKTVYDLKSK